MAMIAAEPDTWMHFDGPERIAFLSRFTSEPAAAIPLRLIIQLSSSDTGGADKRTLRLVSRKFLADAEEGTLKIKWIWQVEDEEEEELPRPNTLLPLFRIYRDSKGRIMERLSNVKIIDCTGSDIMDLNGCPSGMEVLNCSQCYHLLSLAPLAACTNLRELRICDSEVSNIKPLVGCVKLEWLDISCTPVSDIGPLSACVNLKVLRMTATQVSDLCPLSDLRQLRTLHLGGTPVTDLTPLSTLSHLETLDCCHTGVSDLTPLSKCSELKTLGIDGTCVESLTPLLQCKKLQYLSLDVIQGKTREETGGYVQSIRELMPGLKLLQSSMAVQLFCFPKEVCISNSWDNY